MRSPLILIVILALALISWLSVVLWVPLLSSHLLTASGSCATADLTNAACREILSSYGATGDLFGAITSLFSGLALFGVAFTLWLDVDSRRESRKPLVVSSLNADSVWLDKPTRAPNASLQLTVAAGVYNSTNEPALNVGVSGKVKFASRVLDVTAHSIQLPLNANGSEESKSEIKIEGQNLESLLASLTSDGGEAVTLDIETTYESLEGVKWCTSATYRLYCNAKDRRKRLNAVRSDTDDFELWQNDAAVPIDLDVVPGSWRHKRRS